MDQLTFALQTVRDAGAMLLNAKDAGFDVMQKGDDPRNIVTNVDHEINTFMTSAIKQTFPDHGIYSEEASEQKTAGEFQWVIDPIDGTANFSRGIPHFGVCLGLLERGIPVLGAVYNPVTSEMFHFKKGEGVFLNGKPIHVSRTTDMKSSHVFLHAGRKQELQAWGGESYRRLLANVKKSSNFGSSALDICFVAAGRIEANVYGTLSTLDIAPALGILAEAGGVASDRDGNPLSLSSTSQMAFTANNPTILDGVRTLLVS